MGVCKVFLLGSVLFTMLCAIGVNWLMSQKQEIPDISKEQYWGSRAKRNDGKEDTTVKPFQIRVSDDMLTNLHNRLQNTRYQTDLEDGSFEYGFQVSYIKEIVQYWLKQFDWRKQEKLLNTFNHFKTKIEGLDIHFVHAKPKNPKGQVFPILLLHGWPGSFFEFYKVIPMLTDPNGEVSFEVVCPSLPGYGYSDAPKKTGFDASDAARVFKVLMERLGHRQFYVQAGDFGATIAHIMAVAFPHQLLGIHSNFFQANVFGANLHKIAVGAFFPSLLLETNETTSLYPFKAFFVRLLKEVGYNWIQSTRPDTISMGLTDSPVGLASYILEKFCNVFIKVRDGLPLTCDLTESYTLDEVLTNIMIYWTNANFVSSARFYKELYRSDTAIVIAGFPVDVPAGLAQFPDEGITLPRSLARSMFTNIVQYTEMPSGGHFAALEEPRLLADDVISFVTKTIKSKQK